MSYYQIPDPEDMIKCPYDANHEVPAKRMQYHLTNCRKKFARSKYARCPFNARHEMPKKDLNKHIANCPDKAVLESILAYEESKKTEEGRNFKGCTDLPKYNEADCVTSENWEEDIQESPNIGVNPAFYPKVKCKDFTRFPSEEGTYGKSYAVTEQTTHQQSQVLSYCIPSAGIGRGGRIASLESPNSTLRTMASMMKLETQSHGAKGLQKGNLMSDSSFTDGKAIGRGRAAIRAEATRNFKQNYYNGDNYRNNIVLSDNEYRNGVVGECDGVSPDDQFADSEIKTNHRSGDILQTDERSNVCGSPPVLPVVKARDCTGQQKFINADRFVDAKNKKIKKMEKKLKQIQRLEEKSGKGFSLNKDEVLKLETKESLLEALHKLKL